MNFTNGKNNRQFLDTNVLVYAHDQSAGKKYEIANQLLLSLWQSRLGSVSIQVFQEFFVTVTRKTAVPLSAEEASFVISKMGKWRVHSPNVNDLVSAIQIQQRYQISFWDALIIRSAERLGCAVVWSEDMNDGQFYGRVQVKNPFLD